MDKITSFEVVPTEYTDGTINGSIYTSKCRVVARAPHAFMFVGYGLNIVSRDDGGNHFRDRKIAPDAKRATLEAEGMREKIDSKLGEGAHAAVMQTFGKRGMGTVLLNGGGKKLRLPHAEAGKLKAAEYSAVSPTTAIEFEGQKTCIQCSKALRPRCASHRLAPNPLLDENHPRTLEDCQRLTNYPVVGLFGYGSNQPREWWPFVSSFYTWDGESYEQEHFCSDRCAAVYGLRAAQELPHLEAGGQPAKKPFVPSESHSHYDVAAEAKRQREEIERSFGQKIDPKFKV